MYNRLDRKKNPPDIKYASKGGIPDLIDNLMKESFLVSDDEYDILLEGLEDKEEYDYLLSESLTYSEAKKLLLAIKSLL